MPALTAEATESAAKALAEACNGGDWARDYTEAQKDLWRERVRLAMAAPEVEGVPV